MIRTVYDIQDLENPLIPSRSRLYHLEPIGIGTPFVESLTSYVARLAQAHHVTPKSLVSYEILPFQGKDGKTARHYGRLAGFWLKGASSINGVGPAAREWVQTLQGLTLCSNLRYSTMLTWSEVIALNRLIRGRKAWCPNCYEEWKCAGHVIYEPLLWSIQGVSVCNVHRCFLSTECPYEDCKSQESLLMQVSRPGYCSKCSRWLGISTEFTYTNDIDRDTNEWKWQCWITSELGVLITAAPTIQPPQKAQIKSMINGCVEQIANGNMSELARLSNVMPRTIRSLIYEGIIPYLETLLQICYKLSISLLEFLTNDTLPGLIPKKRSEVVDIPQLTTERGRPIKSSDIEKIKLVLERELAKTEPPYSHLTEIASQLGCSVFALRKYCPELCSAITSRLFKKLTQDDLTKMRNALEEMLTMENPPSLTKAAMILGYSTDVLRWHFPDLARAIVTRYQERFSFVAIQKYLLNILEATSEPFPSLEEAARNFGCSSDILLTRCPELCRKIVERYKEYRHRRHEARVSALCDDVRQAVLRLHERGIYPSAMKVSFSLSDSKVILTREVYEFWQNMLAELGWKK